MKSKSSPKPKLPTADVIKPIRVIPHAIKEMLDYMGMRALESSRPGGLAYDSDTDEVIYHHVIDDQDTSLFPELGGTEEIWVIQAGVEPTTAN